ncbi:alpha-glucuronidase family glycosyl hydrolase [Winogradskyella sp. SYSU M77433]|uniref:alpha-glucuronidase family glycosyl hydrolase n=1 Tax=Winogradskyella sp. SYSU M77433 TaxID=3042722 RepID=UPI0024804339|nr:alpha-glucuronidase family glycosyl hydrolase [Winogradskyella sp. SYSU M77433]MDH7911724.1 alpha-glucuronidase family glycosyl hydrolase [Winogradskyella sp. SYSU M77433]
MRNLIVRYHALLILSFILVPSISLNAENGYDLWLRYSYLNNSEIRENYSQYFNKINISGESETLVVIKNELLRASEGMLKEKVLWENDYLKAKLIFVNKENYPKQLEKNVPQDWASIGEEGFSIKYVKINDDYKIIIAGNSEIGLLYGTFELLKQMQMQNDLSRLNIIESPKTDIRLLNHWDNLDRTVERGYAGFSIWNWHKLPEYIDPRYEDYARANASIGINGTVLTNVNANALVLTPRYIEKVKALADLFRPYGIKVYLTARFSAPIEIGELETADPLDEKVKNWWAKKTAEIYKEIPDFGGFLVKANSEGQPGPQNYGRNHADGANMLADAVAPFGGIIMWRAFVYSEHDPTDRAKQAYSEFVPYDGKFRDNVIIQVKNGAIDFQPREPFHPMFGAMPKTPLMMEFQITQEYLGFSTHMVFLPKLYEEVLKADTYREGEGSTVAKVVDGSLHNKSISGMAGVSNIGTDINWTGHPFAQANWYGFGRLAWDPYLSEEEIAEEWLKLTFSTDPNFIETMIPILMESREAVVNYMTPLGLHHLMATGHHYGPGPWVDDLSRPEWNPTYYHKADKEGIGFNRSETGTNAVSQYEETVAKNFNEPATTPEELLLWFHHLSWDYKMKDGNILWDALALKYQEGVNQVNKMISTWEKMKPYIDEERFEEVKMLLSIQLKEAKWWRDSSLVYFQEFSGKPIPNGVPKPGKTLEEYKSMTYPYAPGIRPRW